MNEWTAVDPQPSPRPNDAPLGTVWVCAACGKTATNWLYGPRGWDESCALNSVLCHDTRSDIKEVA